MHKEPQLLSKNQMTDLMKSKGMNRKQRRDWFKKNKPVQAKSKQEEPSDTK
jgi:hypothetical protein